MKHPSSTTSAFDAKKSVDDVWPLTGKRVLVRADFNVPVHGGVIENDFHIRCAIPTIRRVIDQGGICILLSHRGRPHGVTMADAAKELAYRRPDHALRQGRTAFFANLKGLEKALILSWSSKHEEAALLPADRNSGKSFLFSSLPDEEKTQLLHRFFAERSREQKSPGYEEECSLHIVAVRLAELLDQNVFFAHDCLQAHKEVKKRRCGEVILLENLRFYVEESSPDEKARMTFATALAALGDIYINDAFGVSHREAASITEIPKVLGHSAAGYWMQREISSFSKALSRPVSPLIAIIGGAKASDKVALLANLLTVIDCVCIGGGMSHTFLKALGYSVGNAKCEADCVAAAKHVLEAAKVRHITIFLPIDHVCHTKFAVCDAPLITSDAHIPDGYLGLDIGPKTTALYSKIIADSKTCIWNGPMGVFEMPCYSKGTFAIAKAMGDSTAKNGILSVVAGGDSAAAVEVCGQAPRVFHVSTGGGASLELLEGRVLPGVAALDAQD